MQEAFAQEMPVFSTQPPINSTGTFRETILPVLTSPSFSIASMPSPIQTHPLLKSPMPDIAHASGISQSQTRSNSPQDQSFTITDPPAYNVMLGEVKSILVNKLAGLVQDRMEHQEAALEQLMFESGTLEDNRKTLQTAIAKLKEEILKMQDSAASAKVLLARKNASEGAKLKIIDIGSIDTETVLIPDTPLARQLMEVELEELACGDCLYALGQGFLQSPHLMQLGDFVRSLRAVARRQFMARALKVKIRQAYFHHPNPLKIQ